MIKLILWEKIGKRKKTKDYTTISPFTLIYLPGPYKDLPKEVISYRQLESIEIKDIILSQYPDLENDLNISSRIYEIYDKYNLHTIYTDYKKYLELLKLDLSSELLRLNSKYQIIIDKL